MSDNYERLKRSAKIWMIINEIVALMLLVASCYFWWTIAIRFFRFGD